VENVKKGKDTWDPQWKNEEKKKKKKGKGGVAKNVGYCEKTEISKAQKNGGGYGRKKEGRVRLLIESEKRKKTKKGER